MSLGLGWALDVCKPTMDVSWVQAITWMHTHAFMVDAVPIVLQWPTDGALDSRLDRATCE